MHMNRDEISILGPRIREIRVIKDYKLVEIAQKASISKGLLSRIENGRTLPSLPVLFSIIAALGESPSSFFENMKPSVHKPFFVLKNESELPSIIKEDSTGFNYFAILNHTFSDITFNATLLKLEPDAQREPVTTDGMEFIYLVTGEIVYNIGNEAFIMKEGDSLFFDGRVPHLKINRSGKMAKILVIYLLFNK